MTTHPWLFQYRTRAFPSSSLQSIAGLIYIEPNRFGDTASVLVKGPTFTAPVAIKDIRGGKGVRGSM
jgi:hypothetical protein